MRKSFPIPEEKSCIDPNIDNDNIDLLNLCLNLPSKNPAQESHAHGDCAETDFYPEAPNISEFSKPPQKSVKKTSHGPQTLKTSTSEDSVVFLYENKKYGNLQPPIIKEDDFLFPSRRKLRSFKSSFNLTSKSIDKFPFEETKSGHLKITKSQVAYSSKNLSVLVANPSTKVCIEDEEYSNMHETRPRSTFGSSQLDSIMSREGLSGLSKLMDKSPNRIRPSEIEVSEYDDKETCDILSPEIQLTNLGFNIDGTVKWGSIRLPEKKNLYLELYSRITNYTNADCKIVINSEQFNCHLIVLQCYSETFNVAPVAKQLEIPQDKCSPESFAFIYEWMICGEPAYKDLNRDNVLDIFKAAKYLKIKDLVEQCWSFIDNVNIFSEDTAYFLYVLAKERNLPEVCELMLPRIETFFLMLVSSRDWVVIDLADIKLFLSSNYICVNCEMEIFMAAVRWLKYDWTKRKGFTYEVLQCIRFGNIAPWQLVDIKRNPENPEFMELVSDPRICKMIEDGLSYVIIKYWYGHEREDFDRWNDILELNEPQARHWSGTDKTYFTYREFLIYLDKYRRSQTVITLTNTQLNILNHGTAQNSRDFTSLAGPSGLQSGSTRIPPRIPTLDEIIEKQLLKLPKIQPGNIFLQVSIGTHDPRSNAQCCKDYSKRVSTIQKT